MKAKAVVEFRDDGISVSIKWEGVEVDRPNTGGWCVERDQATLANRLAQAINAQKAFEKPRVKTDVHGDTYVEWTSKVLGRRMNADLKRLGF